jgi:hypothetical protein
MRFRMPGEAMKRQVTKAFATFHRTGEATTTLPSQFAPRQEEQGAGQRLKVTNIGPLKISFSISRPRAPTRTPPRVAFKKVPPGRSTLLRVAISESR